jgi:hypothetical protein
VWDQAADFPLQLFTACLWLLLRILDVLCRFARLRETAFEYAFLLKTAGML